MENKPVTIVFLATLILLGVLFFIIEKSLAAGIVAGFITGIVNYYLIRMTVKKVVVPGNENGSGKAFILLGIYFIKMVLFALLIIGLVTLRKYYDINGFLIGFTLSLMELAVTYFILKTNKNRR